MDAEAVAEEFWRPTSTNDFTAVGAILADDCVLEWPQTNEMIRRPENFARLNIEYPAHGPWRFTLNRLVVAARQAVSDASVTDGVILARAIRFFALRDEKITKIVEYWPERAPPFYDGRV